MKEIIVLIVLGYILARCTPPAPNVERTKISKKDTLVTVNFDTVLKMQTTNYMLYLDYESEDKWKLEDKHLRTLHDWIKKVKQDSVFKQLHRDEFEASFIFHIEAGMTKNLSPQTARKRMDDISRLMTDILGFKDYDVEVFKILKNLKYKGAHDIEIKINRLKY